MKVNRTNRVKKQSFYKKAKSEIGAKTKVNVNANMRTKLKCWVLLLAAAAMLPTAAYAAVDLSTQGKQQTYDVARSILDGTSGTATDNKGVSARVMAMYAHFENAGYTYGRFAGDFARNEGFMGTASNQYMNARAQVQCDGLTPDKTLLAQRREALLLALANGYLDVFRNNIDNDAFVDVAWRDMLGVHHSALVNNGLKADFWPLVPAFAAGSETQNAVLWGSMLRATDNTATQMQVSADMYLKINAIMRRVAEVEAAVARGELAADDAAVAAAYQNRQFAAQWLNAMGLSSGMLGIGEGGAVVKKNSSHAFYISVPELGGFWRKCRLNRMVSNFSSVKHGSYALVLDLKNDAAVGTTAINAFTYFDHDGDGFAEQTGWAAHTGGLLVMDRNGSGTIDSGAELFGSYTRLANGNFASNSFVALAELDSNNDGVIDANDPGFASLRVWQDANLDGVVQAGELLTLAELGIKSISLSAQYSNAVDTNENYHYYLGEFTWEDGTTGKIDDVWLANNVTNTQVQNFVAVGQSIAALPDLLGMGKVHSLHQVMVRDVSGELQSMVEQFIQLQGNAGDANFDARKTLAQDIVLRWANAHAYAQDSRGVNIDGRIVYALEAFTGETVAANPDVNQVTSLTTAFHQLNQHIYGQLMLQTHYADLIGNVKISFNGVDKESVKSLVEELRTMHAASAPTTEKMMSDFASSIRYGLGDGSANFSLLNALRAAGNPYGDRFDLFLSTLGGGELIIGTSADDVLWGTSEPDVIMGRAGNDQLYGGDGDDELYGEEGDDLLYGEKGNDKLYGGEGNDYLYGGSSSPEYEGEEYAGENWLEGGPGDDYLFSGYGIATYYFESGWGSDTIYNYNYNVNQEPRGTILFGDGISPQDIRASRYQDNLYLSLVGSTEHINVINYFNNHATTAHTVKEIKFADGTVWSIDMVKAMVSTR